MADVDDTDRGWPRPMIYDAERRAAQREGMRIARQSFERDADVRIDAGAMQRDDD